MGGFPVFMSTSVVICGVIKIVVEGITGVFVVVSDVVTFGTDVLFVVTVVVDNVDCVTHNSVGNKTVSLRFL